MIFEKQQTGENIYCHLCIDCSESKTI